MQVLFYRFLLLSVRIGKQKNLDMLFPAAGSVQSSDQSANLDMNELCLYVHCLCFASDLVFGVRWLPYTHPHSES